MHQNRELREQRMERWRGGRGRGGRERDGEREEMGQKGSGSIKSTELVVCWRMAVEGERESRGWMGGWMELV
jgi:hypothetical protein